MSPKNKQFNSGNLVSPTEQASPNSSQDSLQKSTNDPLVGQTIGKHYQVLSCCGKGGMSTVYKAKDLSTGGLVAIKFLAFEGKSGRDQLILRFQREARVVGSLDHANVISVHAIEFTADRQPFLVLDYAEGETLAERIHHSGKIPIDESLDIFIQLCDGIAHAHEKGILHRDLKPGNVILLFKLFGGATVKILDFGIAKLVNDSASDTQQRTRTGDVFGSPLYMSPEQGLGKTLTASSDLYSLGCLMFETLTGVPPLLGKTAVETILKHQTEAPISLKEATLGMDFPPELENIVWTLLAKDPADRFQSAQELATCLRQLKTTGTTERMTQRVNKPSVPSKPGRPVFITAITLTIALISTVILGFRLYEHASSTATSSQNSATEQAMSRQERDDVTVDYEAKYTPGALGCDYSGYALSPQGFSRLAKMRKLNWLNLNNTTADDAAMKWITGLNQLNTLNLAGTKVTDEGIKTIAGLSLRGLELGHTNISNASLQLLAMRMPGLEKLDLRSTRVDDNGIKALAQLKELNSLNLSETLISDKALEALSGMPRLEELSLAGTNISNAGLKQLKNMKFLSSLDLSGTSITDSGLSALSSLKKLKSIGLKKTRITNSGLAILVKLPSLHKINLDGTVITDDGLALLLKLNNPSYLHLQDCPGITSQGLVKLRTLCPNCEFNSAAGDDSSVPSSGGI